MKKHLLLTSSLLLTGIISFGQISKGGLPTTFTAKYQTSEQVSSNFQTIEITKPDLSTVMAEDNEDGLKGKPYRVAVNTPTSISIENSGTWEILKNGDKIWRLSIKMEDAKALGLYFSEPVKIPFGGKLHAYNESHSQYVGAYTSETPSFQSMEMIEGELLTLEYYMSSKSTSLPTINISSIAYFYRGVEGHTQPFKEGRPIDESRAGSCQVDVACSEITGWEEQRDAVVHYSFSSGGGTYVCTGAVVNNTANDCKPYILTANHCGEPDANSDINGHVWYFNYQRSTCTNSTSQYTGARSETMSGGTLKASSSLGNQPAGNSNEVDGSDFALIELNSDIPSSYNAYYAGWSISTTAATSGVGIHHPAGHEKKISTYSSSLSSATYNGGWSGAHWRVTWVSTTNGHGVTEGGSSGSPIYNQNGLIVGFLSGGSSFCNATSSPDLYGKMDKAWDDEGSNTNQQLKAWLDPSNTGATTLTGTYAPCSGSTGGGGGGGGGTGSGPCAATSTDCNAGDEYISKVELNTISNSSGCDNYTDYTSTISTTLNPGESYNITITANTYYNDDEFAVYIDWNNDSDFEDAGERVVYERVANGFNNTFNFTVPNNATMNEDLIMRVRTLYQPSDGDITPCGTSQYGEVEDYTVRVEEAGGTNGIDNTDLSNISIYPNPTNNVIYVNLTNISNIDQVTLRDVTGRVINTITQPNGTIELDLSNEAKGVYFVYVKSTNGSITKKIVKY